MAEYLGLTVDIPSNDPDHLEYLKAAGEGRLVLQRCGECGLLRYPPGPACPYCQSLERDWQEVSGKGTIYSYEIVTQAINPAYRELVPYPVVLVELDEQRGVPDEHEALRLISSLVDGDGGPESEQNVAIGARVEAEFADLGDGLGLPRFRLSDEPPEHELWQFPS
ncbi:MAG: OB-fold domain-containing protein [Dehalococcoidia bacterium]